MSDINQKKIVLRLPGDLAKIIEILSEKRLRSLNSQMIALLKIGLVSEMEEQKALAAADELITKSVHTDK